MSEAVESAEPTSEALEVRESEEPAQIAENQPEQQEKEAAVVEANVRDDGAEATVEVDDDDDEDEDEDEDDVDAKCEEVAQEVGVQEQVREEEEVPTVVQTLEREEKQEKEEEEEQKDEQNVEKPLEDLQDTMQLPVVDTSQGAIEDEEMPSMVTLSSPLRTDESQTNVKQDERLQIVSQPNPVKENDDSDDSVCVIDDDDDEEEEDDDDDDEDDNEEGEGVPFDEDEDGTSYSDDDDSEDSDRQRYPDNYEKPVRDRRRVQQDEDDEEDDEEREDGEDMENDSEPDGFDVVSDDATLRHSNGLTKHSKERSASLQDLNLIKGPSPKKINVNPFSHKARMERNQTHMDRRVAGKQYAHVESKVKKYIMDLNEQRRLSTERRRRAQEEARYRHQNINELQLRRNEEIVMTCKTVRDYVGKGLQEVAECEEESEESYRLPQYLENGEISIFPSRSMGNGEKLTRPDDDGMDVDVDPIDVETTRHDEKVDRINGATVTDRRGIHRRESYSKPVMNGEDPSSTVSDLRTLTYEEYMKGSIAKAVPEEIIEEDEDEIQEALTPPPYNDNGTDMLRIGNVTSVYRPEQQIDSNFHDRKTPPRMVHQATETPKMEDPEVTSLKTQLQNRNIQFENLVCAYQKTVSENMAVKAELENLRKMVSDLQEQSKPVAETTTTAIQTDHSLPRNMPNLDTDADVPIDPKLATTSMISGMSSQWTDSIGSALISLEPPPNVTNVLNSDDSTSQAGKTPLKQKNAFSRAFLTSSRILQTLSNITHGKSKQSKQSKERARKLSASEKEPAADVGPSNPKKRKATDTLEISSSAQPFKIPHKEQQPSSNTQKPETVELGDEDSRSSAAENDNASEIDLQQMVINNDDVKVFVYPEDECGQEHSFLIQAREVTNNTKPGVRECGPYLLGNVEVFMTEMNGTINIWGKELNQSSTMSQIGDEMETSTRSKDLKSGLRWQSTPRIFNEGSASTSKKSRVVPRFTHQQKQHLCEGNNTMTECENCHSHGPRLSRPCCSHESQQRPCCPAVHVDEMHCGYGGHRIAGSCCRQNRFVDSRRFSMNDVHHTYSPCCHGSHTLQNRNLAPPEQCTGRQPYVRRHSFEPTDDEENAEESNDEENEQFASKGSHVNEDNSSHSCSNGKLAPPSLNNRRGSTENTDGSIFMNDSDPLLGQRQASDADLQNSKRRPRGKKVRGVLLDFLKGCGDCRSSNSMNKTNLQHNASIYAPSTSTQHKIACPPNQPGCSLRSSDKCSSCRTGPDKIAEFEAQLEYFRSQLHKMRSHSVNMSEMEDTIRKDNTN